eukprot:6176897-Pleurochrysis_carterae.AAC.4
MELSKCFCNSEIAYKTKEILGQSSPFSKRALAADTVQSMGDKNVAICDIKRHDVRRGATDDSAAGIGADAQIRQRSPSASDVCSFRIAYKVSYIDGKLSSYGGDASGDVHQHEAVETCPSNYHGNASGEHAPTRPFGRTQSADMLC